MMWFLSCVGIFLLVTNSLVTASGINIVCYFINSNGYSLAPPETLDASLCTHINYAFAEFDDDGFIVAQNENLDIGSEMYIRVTNLTAKNPSLKVLLSVGGGTVSASKFAAVAESAEKRKNFITSAKEFLDTYNFHGLDIDWEKPTADDAENFVTLVKELKAEFDELKLGWILSAAVYPNPDAGYIPSNLASYLDMFNVMTYNYYGSWSAYTGQNSPLFESSIESSYERLKLNVAASMKNWINAGVNQKKLNVGLAFYGRSFTLTNPDDHGLHAPITGAGTVPTPTFRQICTGYENWTTVWDEEQKNPYKYLDDQWLGYDNNKSIGEKVRYVLSQGIAGVMIWHIGGDDLKGECGEEQGLLKTINTEIENSNYK